MIDNTLKISTPSSGVSEIYTDKVFELFDEYKASLPDPDEDIKKSVYFTGALKAVYLALFKPHEPQYNNRNTQLDLSDINTLDRLWNVYTSLCYRNGIRPTLQRFSVLTGISEETFSRWRNQEVRAKDGHSESYKKWRAECEANIIDAVLSNNVGAIFLAKSDFGYRETSPTTTEEYLPRHDTAEEIAARHAGAVLPEKPVFDD